MNHVIRKRIVYILLAASVSPVWSDDLTRSEKSQIPQATPYVPTRTLYQQLTDPNKLWTAEGSFGVERDNNITPLLTNSNINSNTRLPDTILLSHALVGATPRFFGRELETEFSYAYDRFDFQDNTAFSYYNHSLNLDLYPRLAPKLRLDVGGYFDWSGDTSGIFSDDQGGILGVIWRAPLKIKVKTGYEYRHDHDRVDSTKTANSNIYYLYASRLLTRNQSAFMSYRFRDNEAEGADFTYQSHSLRLGWIDHWTTWFKTTCIAAYLDKPYTNVDDRFLVQRHDHTYTATIKPAFTVVPGVDIILSYSYLKNNSNVNIKSYTDQIYGAALEGRF